LPFGYSTIKFTNAANYDFTDFVDTVKAFEKNILYCRAVGDRISGDGSATKFCLSPLGNFSMWPKPACNRATLIIDRDSGLQF